MDKPFKDRVADAYAVVPSITAREAANLREGCEPVVFIDPRPADAIGATTGLIPGAQRIALGDIATGALPPALVGKQTRIITSCQAGPMAAVAAHELQKLGFARVSFLEGGTQAWLEAGLPTER